MTTTDYLALEFEDYGSRPADDTPAPTSGRPTVSVPALVALTLFFVAFVGLSVYLGGLAGAC